MVRGTSVLKKIKRVFDPVARARRREFERLRQFPRYVPGETEILGKPLVFNDACTFINDYVEIVNGEIYFWGDDDAHGRVLDCGANIGIATIFLKMAYPQVEVTAFEPDPTLFELLVRNIESFGLHGVEAVNAAVADRVGTVEFLPEGGHSGRIPKPGDTGEVISVPAVRLRDHLAHDLEFLKLDIEGAEYSVLGDASDKLSGVERVFVEYHSHCAEVQNLGELLNILREAGFRYHIREAFSRQRPFVDRGTVNGMDLQLNIFGSRS